MGNTLERCGHLLNDLYPLIFSYLSPREVAMVSLTSRQLHGQVSDQVWKELARRDFAVQLECHRQGKRDACTSCSSLSYHPSEDQAQEKGSVSDAGCYKDLYRRWRNEVLVIYHVFSADSGDEDVARTLWEHGAIKAAVLVLHSGMNIYRAQPHSLMEQLEEALSRHQVVLYISNGGVSRPFQCAIGDALADFVAQGGSAILFPFATATEKLLGRWEEQMLNPIRPEAQISVESSLRRPAPDHPLFKNVKHITATYRGIGRANHAAETIASYEDGTILSAQLQSEKGLVLAINLFPLSVPRKDEKGRDGGWEEKENNDVPTLLVNAVRYAMNHATAVPRTRHRG